MLLVRFAKCGIDTGERLILDERKQRLDVLPNVCFLAHRRDVFIVDFYHLR